MTETLSDLEVLERLNPLLSEDLQRLAGTVKMEPDGSDGHRVAQVENPEFAFALLDLLEEKGFTWSFDSMGFNNKTEGQYRIRVTETEAPWEKRWSEDANTKTFAICRATLAVMESGL